MSGRVEPAAGRANNPSVERRATNGPALPLEEAPPEAAIRAIGGASDDRPHMPEPPPVRLEVISDVVLPTVAGLERQLDAFYVRLLRFERGEPGGAADGPRLPGPVYWADNHGVRFEVFEPPGGRESCRPIGIVTPHLDEIVQTLTVEGVEFEYIRGLVAGEDGVLLRDPAGNWLILVPWREVR